jgi:hypothetical protein
VLIRQKEVWLSWQITKGILEQEAFKLGRADSLLKMSQSYMTFFVLKKNPEAAFLRSQKPDPGL